MKHELFKDDSERMRGINDLKALLETEGWRIVEKAVDASIEAKRRQLETEGFSDLRSVERLQDELAHLYKLKKLPILLMQDAQDRLDAEPTDDTSDPYDQSQA